MLYIMRHGKTDWNDRHKLQGRTDIPLNNDGREMARAAAEEYKDVHLDVCFCSPLQRAKETAEILLQGRDVPIITDDRLLEMSFGIYEGVENSFSTPELPINVLFWHPEEYTEPVEGGESLDELFSRTSAFVEEKVMPELAAGKDVLIVGHGAMNSALICGLKKRPRSEFWAEGIPQCKLMKLL
ncbi:MAG: histidine phosphatase family protein [Clostridiales bacterium]|nr:histidine phosphatase family protein [Clostridiales bacterium]